MKDDTPTNPAFTENLIVENTATTGTSNIYLKTNNSTKTARVYMGETGLIKLDNNLVNALQVLPNGVLATGRQVFPNGVLATGRRLHNKLLSLYDMSTTDNPANATFFRFRYKPRNIRISSSSNYQRP